ncbi:MAG TPA: hypothetical protein VD813_02835 [Pseudonocardia sp.]|nr:hypothetical protein [Pseudonocardia sp.]
MLPTRVTRSTRRAGAALLAAIALGVAGCTSEAPAHAPTAPPPVSDETAQALADLESQLTWTPQAARLELGVTHTQDSLDPEEPDEAVARGREILSDGGGVWQNHHLMGFGTLNPEPSPGEYDWTVLDRRMELTRQTGDRTVLTLCCAPDWMKGGQPGETDWTRLEAAPDPEFFDDFARLSAIAVERYPQIERVLVWNELKGFYRSDENRWDYEGYTELYNQVYTAVKQVRPDVQIGGPYVVLTSLDPGQPDASDIGGPWGVADQRALDVVEYWLDNNVGAEFLAIDGGTATRQGTLAMPLDQGAQKFADLTRWVRERSRLAIWWAEFYPDVPEGEQGGPSSPASAAATLASVAAFAESGVSIALLWGPQGHGLEYAALWTDSTVPEGGQPTPLTEAWRWLVPRLAAGDVEIGRSPTLPLLAFRGPDGAVVVNLTGEDVVVAEGTDPLPGWAIVQTPDER